MKKNNMPMSVSAVSGVGMQPGPETIAQNLARLELPINQIRWPIRVRIGNRCPAPFSTSDAL
jgi:hypothetical protein